MLLLTTKFVKNDDILDIIFFIFLKKRAKTNLSFF